MLKELFGSKARVKLLKRFLLHADKEFYVRELSRDLDEQINGVRRELANLKKMGLLRLRSRDKKKYYFINTEFPFFQELRSIFLKAIFDKNDLQKSISELGNVDLLVLSGAFTNNPRSQVDLLVVGDLDKDTFAEFIENYINENKEIRYSLMTTENFKYRVEYHDSFVGGLIHTKGNAIVINKLKEFLKRP